MAYSISKDYVHNAEGTYVYDKALAPSVNKRYTIDYSATYQPNYPLTQYHLLSAKGITIASNAPRIAYYIGGSGNPSTSGSEVVFNLNIVGTTGSSYSDDFDNDGNCNDAIWSGSEYISCQGTTGTFNTISLSAGRYGMQSWNVSTLSIPFAPVYASQEEALNYVNNDILGTPLNLYEEIEPEGTEYTIYNTGQRGTWSAGDVVSNVSTPFYRWARIKLANTSTVDGRLAFYRAGLENGIIKLKPVSVANVVFCEYSTDGGANWQNSGTFPFEYIYGERINELGTFIYATRSGLDGASGIPVFEDETTATAWVNHDPSVDISQALNYTDIANKYKITNPTGAEETGTVMGDGSYLRNYFSQEFVCSRNAIYEISNDFFDTGAQGLWEAIEEGLPMMGSNPIDVICGLKWFPFDISTVLSGLEAPQNYIYFGGYQYTMPTATVRKVINHGGYLDMGSFTIRDAFPNPSDFRNFEPFCKMKIYIPTVGIQDLSYNKYRGKTVSVRLYVDIKSGSTLIALMADGILYDYFNGSCGVDIPITLTDKAELAQAQLRNISNLAGVGINMGTAAATKDIGAAVAGFANFESTMMDINNTSADQFNVTKGGSSPMGNGCFLPNYVYLIFEYIKTDETANLNQLEGRITNRSGSLNSFSGYLQIDSINLRTTADMSENEKNEFVNLLQSGIFI